MTAIRIDPLTVGVSGLIGITFTLALLFSINWLSAVHAMADDLDQAITLDLTTWQAQPAAPAVTTTNKSPTPARKQSPAKINSALAENTLIDSQAAPVTNSAVEPTTNEASSDDALPVAVPLFKVTEIPRFLHQALPVYPEALRALGKTGQVVLSVLIDKFGKVRNIAVVASDDEAFTQAAIAAVQASSFMPAKIDGDSVAVKLKLPINFRLL